jgi:hypothetical protein
MSMRITNKTKQLLLVPLNSGETIYLAPGEASSAVDEVETRDNEKIEKLLRGGLIEAVEAEAEAASEAASPPRKKPRS